jgi:hypothetical protein
MLAPKSRPTVPKGTRYPWKNKWGPLHDKRSKVGRLVREIEGEIAERYDLSSPRAARLARRAATYEALVMVVLDTLGKDPKSTPRRATGLQRAADQQMAQLEALGMRREARVPTIYDLMAEAEGNGAARRRGGGK